jgi:O-antigen ligase
VVSPTAASLQASAFGPEGQTGAAWLRSIENDARALVPEASPAPAASAGGIDLGADAPSPPRQFTLSLLPSATLERALWYAALLLAFLLAHRRTTDDRRAALYRATLFVVFGALAIGGVLSHLTAPNRLLWLRDAPVMSRPFGPYVNPNHFAAAMELAVPWLLGYGLVSLVRRDAPGGMRAGQILALAGACICAVAALLAASKLAALTIGVASVVLIAVAIARGRGRRRTILLTATVAGVLLLGTVGVVGPLRGRVADLAVAREGAMPQGSRTLAWTAGLGLAHDFRWTGCGFGAFAEVFPAYMPRGENDSWFELHNDYLDIYVAGGLVAVALTAWLVVAFGHRAARVVRAAAASGQLLPSLGLVLGLLALAVHEFVDFNLQIPANALLFVVIAAVGVAPLSRPQDAR